MFLLHLSNPENLDVEGTYSQRVVVETLSKVSKDLRNNRLLQSLRLDTGRQKSQPEGANYGKHFPG